MSYKKRRHFLLISLAVLLSYTALFCVNYWNDEKNFREQNAIAQENFETAYQVLYDQMCNNMLHISLVVASQEEVQNLMFQAKTAVEEEGFGRGGAKATQVRDKLYRLLGKGWNELKAVSNIRIFQFHLGPGSTSFLRVHAPEKFGDNMDNVRRTVVATNREHHPVTGFETGRVWSGLRGIAPVFAKNPDTAENVQVGAVETGTSFDDVLEVVRSFSDAEVTVFLTDSHATACMWPDYYEETRTQYENVPGFIVEATTTPDFHKILTAHDLFHLQQDHRIPIKKIGKRTYRIMGIPLRDYMGTLNATLPDVGLVVAWTDITGSAALLSQSRMRALWIGVFAFILTEILLWWGVKAITQRLEYIVEQGRQDLQQKNLELESLNQHVSHQKDALERSQKERDEFIGIATHDLKNPLSAIISSTDLLTSQPPPSTREKEDLIDFIKVSCSQMLDIITKLLRINQFDQNSIILESKPVDFFQILSRELELQSQYAHSKHIQLISEIRKTEWIHSDENAIHEIFSNLLSNAIKYSPQGKRIWIQNGQEQKSIWFRVRDEGPGFTEQDKKQLYHKFAKLSAQPTGGETLTGLGLSIVKRYVDAIHGTIHLESSPGTGASFTVRLPLRINKSGIETMQ